MRCRLCGKDYPSRYYFTADGICSQCAQDQVGVSSTRQEGRAVRRGKQIMKAGQPLYCPVCGDEAFREISLPSSGLLKAVSGGLFDTSLELFNCEGCGYVMAFLGRK